MAGTAAIAGGGISEHWILALCLAVTKDSIQAGRSV